ncbi:hypothetical protein Tco_0890850 [Tanacetum coccineum]|uniref:Reverse transcriptase domain-containing protein n=1 Tax=Tanacetum coccineum TaxID=301880 RepID=A0ABQ5C4P3_9ASTR
MGWGVGTFIGVVGKNTDLFLFLVIRKRSLVSHVPYVPSCYSYDSPLHLFSTTVGLDLSQLSNKELLFSESHIGILLEQPSLSYGKGISSFYVAIIDGKKSEKIEKKEVVDRGRIGICLAWGSEEQAVQGRGDILANASVTLDSLRCSIELVGSTSTKSRRASAGEVTETMTGPTLEEYMTRAREGYGSGIARPKIEEKDHFELKGQFFKELRDNTFSGSDNEDANDHIEKFLEIVDLEVISFYKGLNVPTRHILDSKGAIPSIKVADAKKAIQDMADHSQK